MKKSLIIVGVVLLVLILAVIALPVIFKDKIKQIVDNQIDQSLKAEVAYNDFNLSLLKGFPNLTLSVDQISIVGVEEFERDTLLSAQEFSITVNPFRAMFSDNLEIKRIDLQQPKVAIRILEDGTASYDIAIDTVEDQSPEASSAYQFGIQQWNLQNGQVIYDDAQTGFYLKLAGLNHQGSGDFTQDLFDLKTSSSGQLVSVIYDEIEYMSGKQLTADITLEMNLPESKYTFKDNQVSINDFAFGFDGWLAMPENTEDLVMDVTFETTENEFQHLLSLVPGMYQDGFEDIKSSGLVTLNGKIEGTYNEQQIPAFHLSLLVEEGMFQYPDLPTAVENINLEMLLANEDGNLDHTLIDISRLHLDFGQNPVDGKIRVAGLSSPEIKADINAVLDLEQLTTIFPMEGTTVRGNYTLSLKAEGTYDSVSQTFPTMEGHMELRNGFIKSAEFPESLQQIQLISAVSNPTGKLSDTRIEVPDFSFVLDNEPFSGRLSLLNLVDYQWDVSVEGGVDLEKITKIFPLEDMILKGVIRGDLASTGKMSSLEAGRYADIPTSGSLEVQNFSYSSPDLSHPFQISSGKALFNPQEITLSEIDAITGSTDLKINGGLTNYINYLFGENQSITGNLNLVSNRVNLNEWMAESESSQEDQEILSVLEIPSNVTFSLQAQAGTVLYDNMTLSNVRGNIQVKDGMAELRNLSFNSLGGGFLISGIYDPRDIRHPKFDMDVEMQQVGFKEAFQTFNTVKVLAPVAQFINGDFSSSFSLNGDLKSDMMPRLETLNAKGLVNIAAAALTGSDSKLVQGLSQLTQFNSTAKEFKLKDVIMAVEIDNGKMDVAPFVASFGDYQTEISGSTGIDGTMNFNLNMDVPAGVVGTSVNQAIARLTGSDKPVDDNIMLNLKLSGRYDDPKFSLGGVQDQNTTAGMAKSAAEQKTAEIQDSLETLVEQQTGELRESTLKQLDSLISGSTEDSASSEVIKEKAKELLKDDNVNGVLDLFKKKESAKDGN